jgi:hypothetical protein
MRGRRAIAAEAHAGGGWCESCRQARRRVAIVAPLPVRHFSGPGRFRRTTIHASKCRGGKKLVESLEKVQVANLLYFAAAAHCVVYLGPLIYSWGAK